MKPADIIRVNVASVSLSNVGFVVLLRGTEDARALPVFVGAAEAQAIAVHVEGMTVPRPLTHDLFKKVLDCMECRVMRAVVTDLVDGTFYAVLTIERDGVATDVDSRPSDAIALALRCGAPIYVARKVMDQAGIVLEERSRGEAEATPPARSSEPSGLEALHARLAKAVREENYEEAARIRDEIKRLRDPHKN